jgi:two-component system OmpR family sensor kinase
MSNERELVERLHARRRDIGVAYLSAIGLLFFGFSGVQLWRVLRETTAPAVGAVIGVLTNLVIAATLLAVAGWLYLGPLNSEQTFEVSKWGALGLTVPTLIIFVAVPFDVPVGEATDPLITAFTTGGLVGSLYGSVNALSDEKERVDTLYHRNQVLQRVFRHNIRNKLNVVQGYAGMLARDNDGQQQEMAETIERNARSVVDLADVARNLDSIEDGDGQDSVDLATIVDEVLTTLERYYPDTDFETDVPDTAWVAVDPSVEIAIWHLLEFEIQRVSASPITVSVTDDRTDGVTLTVTDTGEDLSESVLTALTNEEETPLAHLDGMDLWVVKWLVESIGGEMDAGRNDPTGARIELTFQPGVTAVDRD